MYEPFHSFPLRAAVHSGHVLDVLSRFTSLTPRLRVDGLVLTPAQRAALAALDVAVGLPGQVSRRGSTGGSGTAAAEQQQQQHQHGSSSGGMPAPGSLAEELLLSAAAGSRAVLAAKAAEVAERFVAAWQEAASAGLTGFRAMLVVRRRSHVAAYAAELRAALAAGSHAAAISQLLASSGA